MLAAKTKKTMTLDNQSIWILMILVMALSWLIQARLKSRFAKYSEVPLGLSGAEVASRMLQAHGIHDVKIVSIPGKLTDHYDPTTKTVNLSEDVYYGRSVAAAAVAAHECGHVVPFSSNIVSWVLLAGVLLMKRFPSFIWIGIGLFALTTLFSFITLPVEINASARAVKWLERDGIVSYETKPMAVDALRWAAYTYVIAAIGSLATLLYYIAIANGRRR